MTLIYVFPDKVRVPSVASILVWILIPKDGLQVSILLSLKVLVGVCHELNHWQTGFTQSASSGLISPPAPDRPLGSNVVLKK